MIGFARIDGQPVGVVANQPDVLAGVIDIDASDKGRASSVSAMPSTCLWSPWSIHPGSCPVLSKEHGGVIRHGAKLLYAYAEATVPKVSLILRKAYGGAYIVMGSSILGVT